MQIVPLPPAAELEKLLAGLLMRQVKVAKGPPESVPTGPVASALFTSDEPVLQVLVRCELPLAASLAAALSVVPGAVVKECVAASRMDASLADNFGEVMNVLARFVSGSGRRFRLGQVSCPPSAVAADLVTLADGSDERRELTVEVPGYAAGRLEFATL
jgi:hypothetical protein